MKTKTGSHSLAYIAAAVLLSAVLIFSGYQALMIYIPQKKEQVGFESLKRYIKETPTASDNDDEPSPPDNKDKYSVLTAINSDFVGWLTVDGTIIDYPVVKSSEDDPEYYLRRNFNKEYSYAGCLFVGAGCDTDSDCFVIYGHNLKTDNMFGTLDDYIDVDFVEKHPYIRLGTPDGDYTYKVFAAFQTKISKNDDDVFKYYESVGKLKEEEYAEVVGNVRTLSVINQSDVPQYPQQILYLSTCSYHTASGRFVVAAYKVDS